jgi:hypothetical protein
MKPRALAAIGLLALAGAMRPGAQDFGSWAESTDRRQDALILESLDPAALASSLELLGALGRRRDLYVADILLGLNERIAGREGYTWELLLRTALCSVFPPSLPQWELRDRVALNRTGIDALVEALPHYGTALSADVLRLVAVGGPEPYQSALMAEGERLLALLERQRGALEGQQAALVLAYLHALDRAASPVFCDLALRIRERSRHPEVAATARAVARRLLGVEQGESE